jgi:uncharacterized protein (DUF1919 family)
MFLHAKEPLLERQRFFFLSINNLSSDLFNSSVKIILDNCFSDLCQPIVNTYNSGVLR